MTASSNFGNVFSVLVASAFAVPANAAAALADSKTCCTMYPVAIPFDNVDEEQIKSRAGIRRWIWGAYGLFFGPISSIFDIFDLLSDVVGISCEYARNANLVPVRLVCGGITIANADCAYDPYPSSAVYFKVALPGR